MTEVLATPAPSACVVIVFWIIRGQLQVEEEPRNEKSNATCQLNDAYDAINACAAGVVVRYLVTQGSSVLFLLLRNVKQA